LFQSLAQLEALTDQLAAAQPLLGRLARETRAASLLELLAQIAAQERACDFLHRLTRTGAPFMANAAGNLPILPASSAF
jgi:hypothetical protein